MRVFVLLFVVWVVSFQYGFAADGIASTQASPQDSYIPSKIRFSTQVSTEERYSFYVDYLFPLYYSQDKGLLVFFNPKQTYHSPTSEELNLGLGVRKILGDEYILGVHLFYDKKYSENHVWHRQRGYGFEFLSQGLDMRFNYYDPIDGPQVAYDGYELGETSLIYWYNLEEPLEGFDFEVGIPLVPEGLKTRVYGGGFFYDSNLTKDVEGFRLRSETNINDWLSLDLTLDRYNKGETNFIGGFRVTIPFEVGKFVEGKNPFKERKVPYIEERLFERVVRDIDIQSKIAPIVSGPATNTAVQNIIYVDNTAAGGGDGSLSSPYNTLGDALTASVAGDTIYVFKGDGTSTGLTGEYTLKNNMILWGSGYDGGYNGVPVLGYPMIDANNVGSAIILADNNTVMGLKIQNAAVGVDNGAIFSQDVVGASIHHNIITGNSSYGAVNIWFTAGGSYGTYNIYSNTISNNIGRGIHCEDTLVTNPIYRINITDNTITGNSSHGISYTGNSDSTSAQFMVSRNVITGQGVAGAGIRLLRAPAAAVNPNITIDLGGGSLGSLGYNSVYNNGDSDVSNDSNVDGIKAENNYWGGGAPTVGGAYTIDSEPFLTSNPN